MFNKFWKRNVWSLKRYIPKKKSNFNIKVILEKKSEMLQKDERFMYILIT